MKPIDLDELERAMPRTLAQMEADAERYHQQRLEMQARGAASGGFNPMNLMHWIDLCERAKVPYVPAEVIASVPTADIVRFDHDPPPETVATFFGEVKEKVASLKLRSYSPRWMVRWSCCACEYLKWKRGTGVVEYDPRFLELDIDDPRAFDIIMHYPDTIVSAIARPWLNLRMIRSYPVEFRVFVEHNCIRGISNYYPQRPMKGVDLTAMMIRRLEWIEEFVESMIRAQMKPLNWPALETYGPDLPLTENHWTADFVVTRCGDVLFLEGGPPHTLNWGADPCCFAPGKTDGRALKPQWERPDLRR